MPLKMTTVSRNPAAILDELTDDLNVGDSRKVDRGLGYMPVHVEYPHRSGLGLLRRRLTNQPACAPKRTVAHSHPHLLEILGFD